MRCAVRVCNCELSAEAVVSDTRDMRTAATAHIEPMVFWQCACGGPDLSKHDYLHLIACTDCETLADEIIDALDNIEKTLVRLNHPIGAS